MLTAHDLWKSYNNQPVVQGISLTLNPGEVLGLLGPNGAGKTTTVGMLYGMVIPDRGIVQLESWKLPAQGKSARTKMGVVTQEDNLDSDFNVFENLCYFAHHYRMTGKQARKRAGELLATVNLEQVARYAVNELSGGMKRRLVLARALINAPKIVFLDEPTTGLDPDARQDFWQLVIQLKQQGCGVLLTTHYMDEAQRLCDRLILLQKGKVIDNEKPDLLIERTIGKEVAEVEGLTESEILALAQQFQIWWRKFGHGYVMALPIGDPEILWNTLEAAHPARLTRRSANLEDVFLKLTGTVLD